MEYPLNDLSKIIEEMSRSAQIPLKLIAPLILSAIASITFSSLTVSCHKELLARINPFTIISAQRGSGKSNALTMAMHPLCESEEKLFKHREAEILPIAGRKLKKIVVQLDKSRTKSMEKNESYCDLITKRDAPTNKISGLRHMTWQISLV
jgi:hypothetical protein